MAGERGWGSLSAFGILEGEGQGGGVSLAKTGLCITLPAPWKLMVRGECLII